MDINQMVSPVDGLLLLRYVKPTELEATLYEPVVCLILQGRKMTALGAHSLEFGAGESLIVSHDLPVVARVTEASESEPYLAMIFQLDLGTIRSLYAEIDGIDPEEDPVSSLQVHPTEEAILGALARYLALAETPLERKILGPAYQREISFRLLMAPHGSMLRRLLRLDSHASKIARAIAWIRLHYKESVVVPELAKHAGMSVSSFHQHFKEITGSSPLQYQKTLRLLEAQRLLTVGEQSVAETALEVGYESPTQFSREYARMFGVPPSRQRVLSAI
ncbi:MAG: AraC family transcriptional regulator [Saprospiraceae bacterium]|nr:AraC family transcriptional regulator [Saprospiraceae bacterium]